MPVAGISSNQVFASSRSLVAGERDNGAAVHGQRLEQFSPSRKRDATNVVPGGRQQIKRCERGRPLPHQRRQLRFRGGHALLQSIEVHSAPTERRRSGRCRLQVRGIGDAPGTTGADLMHPMGHGARTYVHLVGGSWDFPGGLTVSSPSIG